MTAVIEIETVIEALRPFAEYADQMAKQWTRAAAASAYYGVKRPNAKQITYGDFFRASRVLREFESTREKRP